MKLRIPFLFRLMLSCLVVCAMAVPALAAEIQCSALEPCALGPEDFLTSPTPGSGIYLCEVPDASVGVLRCGERVLHTGDVLTADMLSRVVFQAQRRIRAHHPSALRREPSAPGLGRAPGDL